MYRRSMKRAGISSEFVKACRDDLKQLKTTLESLQVKLQGTILQRTKARLFWVTSKPGQIDGCVQKLQSRKVTLSIALGAFQRCRIEFLIMTFELRLMFQVLELCESPSN